MQPVSYSEERYGIASKFGLGIFRSASLTIDALKKNAPADGDGVDAVSNLVSQSESCSGQGWISAEARRVEAGFL